ncbi:hypothetical protein [Clostridium sp.]|uniref:hypothetical protein n=1 Tax=Clostridium sp. TaxID=1506 RepID=UPI003463A910
MKKILSILLVLSLGLGVTACGKKEEDKTVNATSETKQEAKKENKKTVNSKEVDGLKLTANAKIEAVKGDRTKDNVAAENGEYIADGSNIVKAEDYKKIAITIDVENNTDRVVELGPFNWQAELQDGYKLTQKITGKEKDSQIQSKTNGKHEFNYVIEKNVKAEKIKLSYLWIKNSDEFKKLIQNPEMAKMSEEEAMEKHKDIFSKIVVECDITQ